MNTDIMPTEEADLDREIAAATLGPRSRSLSAMLLAYDHRRHTLFDWIDASRLQAFDDAAWIGGSGCDETKKQALAEAFLMAHDLPPAPLASFAGDAAGLVMLSLQDCMSLFRLRVLFDHVAALRNWIDKARRQLLNDWLGAPRVIWLLSQRGLPDEAALPDYLFEPERAAMQLAWHGWKLYEQECRWSAATPAALMRMALPEKFDSSTMNASASLSRRRQPISESAGLPHSTGSFLMSQLPVIFPEASW